MPVLTIVQLASLDNRQYIDQVKRRLRNDEEWVDLLDPRIAPRTHWALTRIIQSIDAQRVRVQEAGTQTDAWLRSVASLRRYANERLNRMSPPEGSPHFSSANREAKAWRAFSATLARRLEEAAPGALKAIMAPYGGLTAAEWLSAREQKREG